MTEAESGELIGVDEAARILGIDRANVRRLIRQGTLPAGKFLNRRTIKKSDLAKEIERRKEANASGRSGHPYKVPVQTTESASL